MNHPLVIALRKQRNDATDLVAVLAAENASLQSENARLAADTAPVKTSKRAVGSGSAKGRHPPSGATETKSANQGAVS
ncbi:hypothetical protein [Kaistia soli]|nr:hypothetical protein [Kaistia soli]